MLKISVKGSQDGGWGLTQSYIKDGNYHKAIDLWLDAQGKKTVFCLVQFMSEVDRKKYPDVKQRYRFETADS